VALLIAPPEYSGMAKRGPYRKASNRPVPPRWRRTYLAQWRNLRGMTQEELSEESGVSPAMISSIEAMTASPGAETLHKLADALSVEVGMILSVNPEGDEPLWAIVSQADAVQREQIARHAGVIVGEKKPTGRRK